MTDIHDTKSGTFSSLHATSLAAFDSFTELAARSYAGFLKYKDIVFQRSWSLVREAKPRNCNILWEGAIIDT